MYFEINGSEFTAPFRMAAAVKCTEFEKLEAPLVKKHPTVLFAPFHQ